MSDNTHTDTTPTVVLVHGAFVDASSWNGVIAELKAAGLDVVLGWITSESSLAAHNAVRGDPSPQWKTLAVHPRHLAARTTPHAVAGPAPAAG